MAVAPAASASRLPRSTTSTCSLLRPWASRKFIRPTVAQARTSGSGASQA